MSFKEETLRFLADPKAVVEEQHIQNTGILGGLIGGMPAERRLIAQASVHARILEEMWRPYMGIWVAKNYGDKYNEYVQREESKLSRKVLRAITLGSLPSNVVDPEEYYGLLTHRRDKYRSNRDFFYYWNEDAALADEVEREVQESQEASWARGYTVARYELCGAAGEFNGGDSNNEYSGRYRESLSATIVALNLANTLYTGDVVARNYYIVNPDSTAILQAYSSVFRR